MSDFSISLVLGFILGIKHAFEADHVLAVSTIAFEKKNPLKAALVGTFWGIGHTTTLFIMGIVVLLLNLSIPEKISLSLELLVGVMLIILGIRAIKKTSNTPLKHHVSFLVGLIHGLAGSGVLMILVLSTIHSLVEGLYYIVIFGLGSTLGMSAMSFIIGVPFLYSTAKFPVIEKYLRLIAGTFSILFGFFVMLQTGSVLF